MKKAIFLIPFALMAVSCNRVSQTAEQLPNTTNQTNSQVVSNQQQISQEISANDSNCASYECYQQSHATYSNKSLHVAIEYPKDWIVDGDDSSLDLTIHPAQPEVIPCLQPQSEANYFHIRNEEGTLSENRTRLSSRIAGQDNIEAKTDLNGLVAYLYIGRFDPSTSCPNDQTTSIAHRLYLFERKGMVTSIYTDKYQLPSVQNMINSIKFTQ